MKSIIKNKVYDTSTARFLGRYASEETSSLDRTEESLYIKRTGEYFLFGEGGPRSRFAQYQGDGSFSGGWRIIPLSYDKAREWAEEHLDADQYISIFGEPDDEEGTEILSVSLPRDVAARIRRSAQQEGMTLSGYIASRV